MRRLILFGGACAILLFLFPAVWAQGTPKALSNADVIKMVQAGVSESAVVATIRANPGNYDTSPHGLIELHKAGVSAAEVNAIAAAGTGARPAGAAGSGSGAPTAAAAAAPAPAPRFQMPTVTLVQSGASQELPLEKTQLAQTKTKPSSLASLAGDSAMTQAIQAGVG
ncbi:MAG: hypothetical protein ACRDOE_23230, partial [Streptosporangiaceae bacterium]